MNFEEKSIFNFKVFAICCLLVIWFLKFKFTYLFCFYDKEILIKIIIKKRIEYVKTALKTNIKYIALLKFEVR